MGFRFRKSINLGGGFRINLSKSGVGYSYGGKGFRVTKRADGKTQSTVSIPGTGISYTETTSKKRSAHSANAENLNYSNGADYAGQMGAYSAAGISEPAFIAILVLALAICAAGLFVLLKFSWWGLAISGVGLVIFAILYNKA